MEKLAIIGSGPAGWSAALYAARAGLAPRLFEGAYTQENQKAGKLPMGQLTQTVEIENYPGFPPGDLSEYIASALPDERSILLSPHQGKGITGPELVELIRIQAIKAGTIVTEAEITQVDFSRSPFLLVDSNEQTFESKTVIVATGASAKYLGLESEEKFRNRGVSACAVCDGALPRFRNAPVCVIGGGDTAAEEALYLSRFAPKVYLIHRRDTLRASHLMVQRIQENSKIEILWNRIPREILGDSTHGVTGVLLDSTLGEAPMTLEISGFFLGIGHKPNVEFLNHQLRLTASGVIDRPIPHRTITSVPGVFAAGDVADDRYRQAIIAASSGAMAALDAEHFLMEEGEI